MQRVLEEKKKRLPWLGGQGRAGREGTTSFRHSVFFAADPFGVMFSLPGAASASTLASTKSTLGFGTGGPSRFMICAATFQKRQPSTPTRAVLKMICMEVYPLQTKRMYVTVAAPRAAPESTTSSHMIRLRAVPIIFPFGSAAIARARGPPPPGPPM